MELKGAVAVVTGGNGGLGQRICHALAKEGANIAVVYAQSANEAGAVADELRKHGVEAEPFQCNLREPAQINAAGRRGGEALRPPRHPDQRRGLQQIDSRSRTSTG